MYTIDNIRIYTILSGDIGVTGDSSDNSYHVLLGADNAVLDGFIITGGNANTTSGPHMYGGGIYNIFSAMKTSNCLFYHNTAVNGQVWNPVPTQSLTGDDYQLPGSYALTWQTADQIKACFNDIL